MRAGVLPSPSRPLYATNIDINTQTQEDFAGDSVEMLRAYQEAEDFANNPDLLRRLTGAATQVRYLTLSCLTRSCARSHSPAHTLAVC